TQGRRRRLPRELPRLTGARIRAARRRARKARSSRRRIDRIYDRLPAPVRDVFDPLAPAFTRPTYRRFVLLALAAILTVGAHTVANLLRSLGRFGPGHHSSYHAFFSRDRWSPWALARPPPPLPPPGGRGAVGGHTPRPRAPRPRVWGEGLPRRPVPPPPFVPRLRVGPQGGRPVRPGEGPGAPPPLGPAAALGLVSAQGVGAPAQ